jgi:hypothetical protein
VHTEYAEHIAEQWRILSAKYGFLVPDQPIARYNVTFKDKQSSQRIAVEALREQIAVQGLDRFPFVVGLGGADYRAVIQAAFAPTSVRLIFPFAGLPIGKAMGAVKKAIKEGAVHEAWLQRALQQLPPPSLIQEQDQPIAPTAPSVPALDPVIPMSYRPLADYLSAQTGNRVTCSFAQIEGILGRALPPSARS